MLLAGPRGTSAVPAQLVPSLPAPPLSAGLASPPPPSTSARSSSTGSPVPRRNFDGETLRPHIKRCLAGKLGACVWSRDASAGRTKVYCREIAEDVKKRMLELEPAGYKFVVSVSIVARSEGASAHFASWWDSASDVEVTETFQNDTILATVLAVAIRVAY